MTDEQGLQDEIERLRQSNDDLYKFAYMAAHELQEPLRTIESFLTLLNERYSSELTEEANEWLSETVAGAVRMRDLIHSLLTLSLVDSQELQFELVNSTDVLQAALVDLKPVIEAQQVQIVISDLPTVQADEVLLALLFRNLIGNSIKYCSARPTIRVRAIQKKEECIFEVSDNGIGFEMKYADKIFLPFERLHSKMDYPGTGLGLALCKRIIDRHGGKIWAQSIVNEGSTFSFSLPTLPNNTVRKL
jgi:light-regulated signal transduction histidine kinase (bacteriophytochrome)